MKKEIIPQINKKEEEITRMILQYDKLIFTICHRFLGDYQEAQNIAQETFVKAFISYESFDKQNEKAWLCKIATNKCKDFLKSSYKKTTDICGDEVFSQIPEKANTEKQIEQKDDVSKIVSACKSLDEPYKTVAQLHFLHEKSFSEISEIQNVPLKTIQTQVYRARDKLRKILLSERGLL